MIITITIFFYFRIYTSAILNRNEPAHELGSLGCKPNRKRVCGSLNRTRQNHYGSEPNRTKPNRDRSKSRLKSSQYISLYSDRVRKFLSIKRPRINVQGVVYHERADGVDRYATLLIAVGAARAEYGEGYTMYCGTGVHLPLPSARQCLAYQMDSSACAYIAV